jgi:hypothetical protein
MDQDNEKLTKWFFKVILGGWQDERGKKTTNGLNSKRIRDEVLISVSPIFLSISKG